MTGLATHLFSGLPTAATHIAYFHKAQRYQGVSTATPESLPPVNVDPGARRSAIPRRKGPGRDYAAARCLERHKARTGRDHSLKHLYIDEAITVTLVGRAHRCEVDVLGPGAAGTGARGPISTRPPRHSSPRCRESSHAAVRAQARAPA